MTVVEYSGPPYQEEGSFETKVDPLDSFSFQKVFDLVRAFVERAFLRSYTLAYAPIYLAKNNNTTFFFLYQGAKK